MAKLYSLDKRASSSVKVRESLEGFKALEFIESISDKLAEEMEDASLSFSMIMDNINTLRNEFNLIDKLKDKFNASKSYSKKYVTSIESLTPVIETIASNLGVKYKMPSLEDFSNPYSLNDCHQIAMEGFVSFIKKIWEKIKSFLLSLLLKINLFFKKLFNMDLQLNEYEDSIGDLISKIKSKDYKLTDDKAIIKSRLPSMLAKDGMDRMSTDYLLRYGIKRVNLLHDVMDGLSREFVAKHREFINKTSSDVKEINGNILESVNAMVSKTQDVAKEYNKINNSKDNKAEVISSFITSSENLKTYIKAAAESFNKQTENFEPVTAANMAAVYGFFRNAGGLNNIPEEVYDKLQEQLDTDLPSSSNYEVLRLINNDSNEESLPYNYNVYLVIANYEVDGIKKFKFVIVPIKKPVETVTDELYPISNKESLISLYEDYRKKYSKINIKAIEKGLSNNNVERFIDETKSNINRITDNLVRIEVILSSFNTNKIAVEDSSSDEEDALRDALSNSVYKDNGVVSDKDNKDNTDTAVLLSGLIKETKDNLSAYSKLFNQYNNQIIQIMQLISELIKFIAHDFVSIYIEVKYELIKYIYNNCKLYVKSYQ